MKVLLLLVLLCPLYSVDIYKMPGHGTDPGYVITIVIGLSKKDGQWQYTVGGKTSNKLEDLSDNIEKVREASNTSNTYVYQCNFPVKMKRNLDVPEYAGGYYHAGFIDAKGYRIQFDAAGNAIENKAKTLRMITHLNKRNKKKELCVCLPRSVDKKSAPKYLWDNRKTIEAKMEKGTHHVVIFMPVSNSPMDAMGMVFPASSWRQSVKKEKMPKPMERAIKWQGPVEMPAVFYQTNSENE